MPGRGFFLGDGGSMPIGFAIAALVMVGTSDALPEWQSLLVQPKAFYALSQHAQQRFGLLVGCLHADDRGGVDS